MFDDCVRSCDVITAGVPKRGRDSMTANVTCHLTEVISEERRVTVTDLLSNPFCVVEPLIDGGSTTTGDHTPENLGPRGGQ